MRVEDFDYDLPPDRIAQVPSADRTASRLLVLYRDSGRMEHRHFRDLVDYAVPGDALILNDTRVIPARLLGVKAGGGGQVECLLLRRDDPEQDPDLWRVLVKPGRRVHPGHRLVFGDGALEAEVLDTTEEGGRLVRFRYTGDWEDLLKRLGEMPLPPYIKERRADSGRYQTVYARVPGSVAAPTAGLHFTEELLEQLRDRGMEVGTITLHVGLGTFRPVQVARVEEHHIHAEYFRIPSETAELVSRVRERGGRIWAVGTTVCRALESAALQGWGPREGWTDLFIYPGFSFRVVDRLITNFHLPKSTLLMLVSALAGREQILGAYQEAIEKGYRFFSFGDAMLITTES
ncbi:tRNA preQ1(34) S-adenosylmethionine ribosyltransferase-isomerase QueA [Kyrpidia spormannii]|uniref:S-adenosylmethionine tRNA ribosyltransferase-isomerase n=2 Tax=Kyrpidia spormannii TaxID=2055160 RepID=A0ACA8ZB90_9BACL|nr:tRNA preQ1(34) S-adenosylmethionine ribosyltransferase-isomerase QueA [Kyrpidia spormannii]CAB3393501.1 S-adenosylmethionine tRNA ribosyltransferase-isomerase [Kyrpidia spormannii]CAB3394423.1 S-adenosylmethionine tRNA ribosyltransferase-isomerase [Kyrpidia spormannii]